MYVVAYQTVPSFRSGLAALVALSALAACDEQPAAIAPTVEAAAPAEPVAENPPPEERVKWAFAPLGPEAEALGKLTVMLPPGNTGSGRTLIFANGVTIEAVLMGSADISKPVGQTAMSDVLGVLPDVLANSGDPRTYLLKVNSESPSDPAARICGEAVTTHILYRDLDSANDKSVTLAFLTADPADASVVSCKRLVYTRG